VGLFRVPFLGIVYSVVKDLTPGSLRRTGYVAILMVITLAIGVLVGNVLDPWLFHNR
jgi:hypothetical protein